MTTSYLLLIAYLLVFSFGLLLRFLNRPLYATWYYSHPPVVQRVARLKQAEDIQYMNRYSGFGT